MSSRSHVRWAVVLRAAAIGLSLLLVAYAIGLATFQRRLLFPRPSVDDAPPRPAQAQQVWLSPPGGGPVEAWYLPPRTADTPRASLLIFFHGNAELIDFQPDDFSEPRDWGMGVLLVEFPGYGRSGGEPSETSLAAAAVAAHDWATAQAAVDPARIVAYGRSLGGAVAARLAAERRLAGLILESTFTSVRSFARQFAMPEFVVRDPFDTASLLPRFNGAVLVLHGERDDLVPPMHAKLLAQAAPRAELRLLRCGHNDCARPWAILRAFLGKNGIIRS